jgi:hypothetical protein
MGAIVPDLLLFFDKYQWLMNNSGATTYLWRFELTVMALEHRKTAIALTQAQNPASCMLLNFDTSCTQVVDSIRNAL